jgi:hypothetical protein
MGRKWTWVRADELRAGDRIAELPLVVAAVGSGEREDGTAGVRVTLVHTADGSVWNRSVVAPGQAYGVEVADVDGRGGAVLVERAAALVRDLCTVRALVERDRVGADVHALGAWLDNVADRVAELVEGHDDGVRVARERVAGLNRGWDADRDGETACAWAWADLVARDVWVTRGDR